MYKEINFYPHKLQEAIIYPDQARDMISAACLAHLADNPVDPAIFARNKDGKTVRHPCVLFDAGKGFLRLYGIGKTGADLLDKEGLKILMALQKHLGVGRFSLKDGQMQIIENKPTVYGIRHLVVSKKYADETRPGKRTQEHRGINHFKDVSATERVEELRNEVLTNLAYLARHLDNEMGTQHEQKLPSLENFDMAIFKGEPIPIPISGNKKAAAYKKVVLSLPFELKGPWSVGKLRSKGFGLLYPLRNY